MPKKSVNDPTPDAPSPTEEAVRPDHYYEITMTSVSKRADGSRRVNQEIIFREFADTSEELVLKNMPMARKIVDAGLEGSEEAAQSFGYQTSFDKPAPTPPPAKK